MSYVESNTADISRYSSIIKDLLKVQTLNVYVVNITRFHFSYISTVCASNLNKVLNIPIGQVPKVIL